MSADQVRRLFLVMMGVGLVPVAATYGAVPEGGLLWFYGISDPDLPTRHILRAIMGLYLGMIVLWLAGALRPGLRMPALWSVFAFVSGIASGRGLSLVLDGWPGPLLALYLLAEVLLAAASWYLIHMAPGGRPTVNT